MTISRRAFVEGIVALAASDDARLLEPYDDRVPALVATEVSDPIPAGDVFSLKDVEAAVALLRKHNVPPSADGHYVFHIGPVALDGFLLEDDERLSYADRALALEYGRMRARRRLPWRSPYEWICSRRYLTPRETPLGVGESYRLPRFGERPYTAFSALPGTFEPRLCGTFSVVAFTDEEKVRIRHHLGYVNVNAVQTFAAGVPAPIETQFIIEGAMNRVLAAAEPKARQLLAVLDGIEQQMVDDHELLAVVSIGEIEINQKEQAMLENRYLRWRAALANLLGVFEMPYDRRYSGGGPGGVNARVEH